MIRAWLGRALKRLPLEVGATRPLAVRDERVLGLGLPQPLRLLYASDLHLGWPWSNRVIGELAAAASSRKPDAVILGGDLADSPAGLAPLRELLRRLSGRPVWAVGGNHDRLAGLGAVRDAVSAGGGRWLEGAGVELGGIRLDGAILEGPAARVLCAHDPAVFPRACLAGYRLVLAGHLHGGQCVLASRGDRLYPGAWINRWTGLRFARGPSTMLVSRGASDTLPLRWNCPREVLMCELS